MLYLSVKRGGCVTEVQPRSQALSSLPPVFSSTTKEAEKRDSENEVVGSALEKNKIQRCCVGFLFFCRSCRDQFNKIKDS